jgi:hypothetical protein
MSREDNVNAIAKALLHSRASLRTSYEKALGKLAMQFSLLHIVLELFSWEIWGLSADIGLILTKDLPIKHLAEKLRASSEHRFSKADRNKFHSILKRIEKISEQRNALLHAMWVIEDGKPVFCLRKTRGKFNMEVPTVNYINAINSSVLEITADLLAFKDRPPSGGLLGLGLGTLPPPASPPPFAR